MTAKAASIQAVLTTSCATQTMTRIVAYNTSKSYSWSIAFVFWLQLSESEMAELSKTFTGDAVAGDRCEHMQALTYHYGMKK